MKKLSPRIIFAGAVQNGSKHLPSVMKNLENISKMASEVGYIFIENDSTDTTKADLKAWGSNKSNFNLVSLDGLNQIPVRTVRLEIVRNTYLELIKTDSKLRNFDFLVVLDMDEVNYYQIDSNIFSDALIFLNDSASRAAVFANQQGGYYDLWALRSNALCPVDVWQEVLDYVHVHKVSDEEAFSKTFAKRVLSLENYKDPIEVNSAFGGLGIYKMQFILGNVNPYLGSKIKLLRNDDGQLQVLRTQICEHVHFHDGIRSQLGSLYIFPSLINGILPKVSFNPSFFRSLLF
jgi:hypothetical protein